MPCCTISDACQVHKSTLYVRFAACLTRPVSYSFTPLSDCCLPTLLLLLLFTLLTALISNCHNSAPNAIEIYTLIQLHAHIHICMYMETAPYSRTYTFTHIHLRTRFCFGRCAVSISNTHLYPCIRKMLTANSFCSCHLSPLRIRAN